MVRKRPSSSDFISYDVLYQDGTRSSNRRIPLSELGEFDREAQAKAIIEAQDRKIANLSGKPRAPIKSISRSQSR
jgi:hypothetical protein